MTQQVGIYIYDEVEVLDFAGPYEVFSTASRVLRRLRPQASGAVPGGSRRRGAAHDPRPRGVPRRAPPRPSTITRRSTSSCVPGGVHDPELAKPRVIDSIARQHATTRLTASVCTAPSSSPPRACSTAWR